jgi:glycosyltransferase involved in cell wall biosynthesis
MIVLDNIAFEIQKIGGVSLVWKSIIDACLNSDLDFKMMQSDLAKENKFYPHYVKPSKIIFDGGGVNKRRLFKVPTPSGTKIFHTSYFRVPSDKKLTSIVTIHDCVQERFSTGLKRSIYLWEKLRAIRSATKLICVSESTKSDLVEFYPFVNPDDVYVIYNGFSSSSFNLLEKEDSKYQPYLVYVGGRYSHKNFSAALKVLTFPESIDLGLKLKVVGGGALTKGELILIKTQNLSEKVEHLGHVSTEELNKIYNFAFALIYPSYFEGFGIPPLEAMAAGCPVICSNTSSLPEVVGDAGLTFDPANIEGAAEHIRNLQKPLFRKNIISVGHDNTKRFSWESTGIQTVNLYKSLL